MRGQRTGPGAVKPHPFASLAQRRAEMIEQGHRDVSWRRRSLGPFYPLPLVPAKAARATPLSGGSEPSAGEGGGRDANRRTGEASDGVKSVALDVAE
jgi:hypothetical protein